MDRATLTSVVERITGHQPVTDMHTHCYTPAFGNSADGTGAGLLLWGIDELVTYHYLVAEVYRVVPASELPLEKFWRMSKTEQANHIWKQLFQERTPVSEAFRVFAAYLGTIVSQEVRCVLIQPEADAGAEADGTEAFEARVRATMPADLAARTTCEIRRGHHLEQVLRVARDRNLDLAVIGRRLPSSQLGFGSKVARIVRKSPCSVMLVPEFCRPHFERIRVSGVCSDPSAMAMEAAVALAREAKAPRPPIMVLSVRQVSSGHDYAGVTFQESAKAQLEHGARDLERFLAPIDTQGIAIESKVVLSEEPALAINHVATAIKTDIVVAGSRGATATAAARLGSTSEQRLMACALPILMVKKKGETLRLLEALFAMD